MYRANKFHYSNTSSVVTLKLHLFFCYFPADLLRYFMTAAIVFLPSGTNPYDFKICEDTHIEMCHRLPFTFPFQRV